MTAQDIARTLIWTRWMRNYILPCHTPHNWWECDVFEVTEAGYFREYEIKMSRSDFLADRRKSKVKYGTWNQETRQRDPSVKYTKHELLEAGDPRGPARFWYVSPEGVLTPEDMPPWAGLILVREFRETRNRWHPLLAKEVKKAPRLHDQAYDTTRFAYARRICYQRFHEIFGANYLQGGRTGLDVDDHDWVI